MFRERDGAAVGYPGTPDYAYCLTVITYTSETPDPAATHAALLTQKPGGIRLNYLTADGQDYTSLKTNNATYQVVLDSYLTYTGVLTDIPDS